VRARRRGQAAGGVPAPAQDAGRRVRWVHETDRRHAGWAKGRARHTWRGTNLTTDRKGSEAVARGNLHASVPLVLACVVGLGLNILAVEFDSSGKRGVDYTQFYVASHLVGTGHVYDWPVLRRLEAPYGIEMPTGRLPVVLYGHKLLGSLPLAEARTIWMAGSVVALVVFAFLWPGGRPWLTLLGLASSMFMGAVLLYGQDVPFLVMFLAAGLWLMERKRPWEAGVVFALCLCKFHLALGIPVLLVARKEWRALGGGALAGLALVGASFAIEGPQWPRQYWTMSQLPDMAQAIERMPNIHGLVSWLPWATAAEIAALGGLGWLLWGVCRGNSDWGTAGAAAAACGVLAANHSYAGDCTLMIPLAVLTIARVGMPRWLRIWALALISPLGVLLLITRMPYLGQMLIVGFVVAAVWAVRRDGRGDAAPTVAG